MENQPWIDRLDGCFSYMNMNKVPAEIQHKVRLWFEFMMQELKGMDEDAMLHLMPERLHRDVAMDMHFEILKSVKLFSGCDEQLLIDLVLNLKPILFLPGQYVCKKGEVGKEMYIVSSGLVQVCGATPDQVFCSLKVGTAFGEISLLAMGEGNKRTANIYSPGFTTLFVLTKSDLFSALVYYPEAKDLLFERARAILNKDNKK